MSYPNKPSGAKKLRSKRKTRETSIFSQTSFSGQTSFFFSGHNRSKMPFYQSFCMAYQGCWRAQSDRFTPCRCNGMPRSIVAVRSYFDVLRSFVSFLDGSKRRKQAKTRRKEGKRDHNYLFSSSL